MERIKSQAAVVRNGIHYLPVVVEDLKAHDSATYDRAMDSALTRKVNLGRSILTLLVLGLWQVFQKFEAARQSAAQAA
ncbi:hypothetical protein [Candidatus Vondammii sp. HM_W22]|uniref:hypothetical protein n=1 Tax=Candidatus Vondammii sp. HM_W22 TaxID=2687299 RepID=UPI001F14229C|nr:hypothetical protein [Candidatus Vondammii sp. HM_W22]